ncbi:MAG: cell division protein FtsA [Bryobacteraceae bacterium]
MGSKVRVAAGIDAGSNGTRCVVSAVEDGRIRFLGYGAIPSRGWVKGRVADQELVADAVRQTVQEAERVAGVSVEGAVVGVGGTSIAGFDSRGLYEFGRPRAVEADDLSYAVDQATRTRLEEDRLLLQVFPQDFTLDGRSGFRNPRGLTCSRLEAHVHLLTASQHDHQSVIAAMHLAHVQVEETIFEPMAAAYASVLPEERARGVAVVDIGAQSTGVVVYDADSLLRASTVPICGEHFTRDVAFGLTVSYEDAELLKSDYGCAILGLTADNTLIEVPSHDGRPSRETTRRQLNEILEARAEELFYYVRHEVGKARMEQSLMEGIVLTGGAAMLNGMCDMAERVLNCPARNGLPVGIDSWPEELMSPQWTSVAGLAMYAARLKWKAGGKPRGNWLWPWNGKGER